MASSHAAALSSARGAGTPSAFLADPLRRSSINRVNRDGGVARAGGFATGAHRSALRAKLRGRIYRPNRTAGRGVMPVEAEHSAVPEAKVRAIFRVFLLPRLLVPGHSANELGARAGGGAEIASFGPAPSPARRDISPHYPVPAVIAHARDRAVPRTRSLTPPPPPSPPLPRDKRRASSTREMIATRAASASSGNSPRRRPAGTSRRRSKCSSA